jgi:hypothetical protein
MRRSWEPYDVAPKDSLLDSMDKGYVEDVSCNGIYQKYSSVYTVFNLIYIRSD